MRLRRLMIGMVLFLFPALVSADLYRYIDERGVIHFTDNYIEIPENQRSKVEIITRPEESAAPQVRTVPDRTEETRPPTETAEGGRPGGEAGVQGLEALAEGAQSQQQFEALIKTKADLDKMYYSLATEKEALVKEQKTLKTLESIRDYQNKVNLFNQRLADYERQRQAFQNLADAYNKSVSR